MRRSNWFFMAHCVVGVESSTALISTRICYFPISFVVLAKPRLVIASGIDEGTVCGCKSFPISRMLPSDVTIYRHPTYGWALSLYKFRLHRKTRSYDAMLFCLQCSVNFNEITDWKSVHRWSSGIMCWNGATSAVQEYGYGIHTLCYRVSSRRYRIPNETTVIEKWEFDERLSLG